MRLRFDRRVTGRDRPDATALAGVRTVPLSELDKLRYTLVPQLRVAHIAGAGHSIRRDQFDRYMQVVRSFLGEAYQPS